MALFKVINIIDGDTIRVSPQWVLGNIQGDIVKIRGYNTPSESNQHFATSKLKTLLINKSVELNGAVKYTPDSEAIICEVYLNGVNVATYMR